MEESREEQQAAIGKASQGARQQIVMKLYCTHNDTVADEGGGYRRGR